MADDELLAAVERIEASTRALLMLTAQQLQAGNPQSRTDQQSVEAVLYLSGFSQAEIGRLLNKTRQSVSGLLKREGLL